MHKVSKKGRFLKPLLRRGWGGLSFLQGLHTSICKPCILFFLGCLAKSPYFCTQISLSIRIILNK